MIDSNSFDDWNIRDFFFREALANACDFFGASLLAFLDVDTVPFFALLLGPIEVFFTEFTGAVTFAVDLSFLETDTDFLVSDFLESVFLESVFLEALDAFLSTVLDIDSSLDPVFFEVGFLEILLGVLFVVLLDTIVIYLRITELHRTLQVRRSINCTKMTINKADDKTLHLGVYGDMSPNPTVESTVSVK